MSDLWPKFDIESDKKLNKDFFVIQPFIEKKKKLSYDLSLSNRIDSNYIKYLISLSQEQRVSIIFLFLSIKTKLPCIFQGPSYSGKTHLIKLFSKIIGKTLRIIQLNNDSGLTLITGQISPQTKLKETKIKKIIEILNEIDEIEDLTQFYKDIINLKKPDEWNPNKFKEIIRKIKELPIDIKTAHFEILQKLKNILNEELSFAHHLEEVNTIFLEALKNGDWVLLDGMEAAQPELCEKIISLCYENPILNLYEKGPDFIYSLSSEKFPIHPEFRLFMTYNNKIVEQNKKLSS